MTLFDACVWSINLYKRVDDDAAADGDKKN